ncbi:beta-phosphoglucomutase [Parapedobacter pyrenivorans]|uniref:Beta-phosphoglucomutase n=1 Tax=Parapedobacter pyrenivorans TaxID=1305674 RepID=A0A917MFN5_9SPHI|nr:beta-phosphoglucomutase [Parapedobacter pyrenivorans]GGG97349.1 beta-phosphoglucomutase [Parapedobacter pyrenivorans]
MKLKACLFDLDGVLVDTAQYHYQAWKKLANTLGFDLSAQQNEQLKGISRTESLNKVLAWGGLSLPADVQVQLAERKNAWYVEMISAMTPATLLPGAAALLIELRREGISIALGSASKNARLILEKTALRDYFDAVVDGNMVIRSKPDPEVFLAGAEKLRVSAAECVVLEDAAAGVEAARRAGMKAVGIGNPADLIEADWVVPDLAAVTVERLDELFC